MPTELLSLGRPIAMTQNQVYALPPQRALLFTSASSPTIQQSTDVAFGTNSAVTLTGGQAEVAGAFIRCTSAAITVSLKST